MPEVRGVYQERFNATLEDYNNFLNSPIWADLQYELKSSLSENVNILCEEDDPDEVKRIQGRISALKYALSLPSDVRDVMIVDSETRARREENG